MREVTSNFTPGAADSSLGRNELASARCSKLSRTQQELALLQIAKELLFGGRVTVKGEADDLGNGGDDARLRINRHKTSEKDTIWEKCLRRGIGRIWADKISGNLQRQASLADTAGANQS